MGWLNFRGHMRDCLWGSVQEGRFGWKNNGDDGG